MAEDNADDNTFGDKELEKVITDSIDQFLLGKVYNEKMVPKWINEICEDVIKKLTDLQKPFKYAVNCVIMQRNGAGCVASHSCYWDASGADHIETYSWPKEKTSKTEQNKATIQCIVSIYAFSLLIPSG